MDKKYEIRLENIGNIPIMHLSGDITAFSDDEIIGVYKSMKLAEQPRFILSLKNVKYINSAGIATIIEIVIDIENKKGSLKIAGLAPHYQKLMSIVGITEYATLYDSIEKALNDYGIKRQDNQ